MQTTVKGLVSAILPMAILPITVQRSHTYSDNGCFASDQSGITLLVLLQCLSIICIRFVYLSNTHIHYEAREEQTKVKRVLNYSLDMQAKWRISIHFGSATVIYYCQV